MVNLSPDIALEPWRGIIIGDGAVIASRSVVTGDVEEFSVVGGVHAKIIRECFPDDLIAGIKQLP